MGKNKGKHGKKTEYAKWESLMAKLENEILKENTEKKKNSDKNS